MGWIVLHHDNGVPVASWITTRECRPINICIDERLFGDTILRVERISKHEFVLGDIFIYNSSCVFACSTFKQRYEWTVKLLANFHTHIPGLAKLIHKRDIKDIPLRGYEVYSAENGEIGKFVELEQGELLNVYKTELPDVYRITGKEGYIRVPDLKTSKWLRTKGDHFSLRCIQCEDDSWEIVKMDFN